MDFESTRSFLNDEEPDEDYVKRSVKNASNHSVPEVEKDWRRKVRPAIEEIFEEDKE